MYNKQVFCYIADRNGKITNKGSIISVTNGQNGEMIITVREQKQEYNAYNSHNIQNNRATA